jgi:hypothetical protein
MRAIETEGVRSSCCEHEIREALGDILLVGLCATAQVETMHREPFLRVMRPVLAWSPSPLMFLADVDATPCQARFEALIRLDSLGCWEQLHSPSFDDGIEWTGAHVRAREIAGDQRQSSTALRHPIGTSMDRRR